MSRLLGISPSEADKAVYHSPLNFLLILVPLMVAGCSFQVSQNPAIHVASMFVYQLMIAFEQHNIIHHAIMEFTANRKLNRFFICLVCTLSNGLYPYDGYKRDHDLHHSFPNIVDADTSIDTKPFDIEPGNKRHIWSGIGWLVSVCGFGGPYMMFDMSRSHLKLNKHNISSIARTGFSLVQWVGLFVAFPRFTKCWLLATVLAGNWFVFISALNHQAKPRLKKIGGTHQNAYQKHQIDLTNSYRINYWLRWLFGGLDNHRVHHLFPHIPWQNLAYIETIYDSSIDPLCRKRTFGEVLWENVCSAIGC